MKQVKGGVVIPDTPKQNHGGKRKGSGRPISEPTKILTFRVKAKDAEIIRAKIKALLKK